MIKSMTFSSVAVTVWFFLFLIVLFSLFACCLLIADCLVCLFWLTILIWGALSIFQVCRRIFVVVTRTQVPWQSGDTHTMRHFGIMSSCATKKNRQTRVSLAICKVGVGMMVLLEVLGDGQQIYGDVLWPKLHLTASTALESTFLVCGSRVAVLRQLPIVALGRLVLLEVVDVHLKA